jgi:hypothetical protein
VEFYDAFLFENVVGIISMIELSADGFVWGFVNFEFLFLSSREEANVLG